MSIVFFLCFYVYCIGVFYVGGYISPSTVANCTFREMTAKHTDTEGGAISFHNSSTSYMNFTIDRCFFIQCIGCSVGGAIYIHNCPNIYITRSRFEGNKGTYGNDINVYTSSCFTSGYIDSYTCSSTATNRVYCVGFVSVLNDCSTDTVCIIYNECVVFFFFFYVCVCVLF